MQYFPETQVMIPCCDILNIAVANCDTLWFISFLQLQNCVKENALNNCFIKNDKVLEKIHFFLFHEAFKKTTFSLNSESRLKIPHNNINNTHASDFIYLPENTGKKDCITGNPSRKCILGNMTSAIAIVPLQLLSLCKRHWSALVMVSSLRL